jgi:hypothetical protein
MYALSLGGSMSWSAISGLCYGPTPRGHHAAALDAAANALYVFGGRERRAAGSTCPSVDEKDLWRMDLPDVTNPGTVTNLLPTLLVNDGTVTWTAPGDDGTQWKATQYDLRYSTATITEANFSSATQIPTNPPQAPGTNESASVGGLESCTFYSFALKTRDNRGNWSAISNTPKKKTGCFSQQDVARTPTSVDLILLSENPSKTETQLRYSIPAANANATLSLSVFDLNGRRVSTLIQGKAESGFHDVRWDLRDQKGGRVHNGIYFLRLRVGDQERRQKVFVVE